MLWTLRLPVHTRPLRVKVADPIERLAQKLAIPALAQSEVEPITLRAASMCPPEVRVGVPPRPTVIADGRL